jgi:integrase/recombinase XerC
LKKGIRHIQSSHTKPILSHFFSFTENQFGTTEINKLDYNIIRSWLARLKQEGMSSKTINRKISCLKSFFKYQLRQGLIQVSPMAKIVSPKNGKRIPVFVKEDDVKEITKTLNTATEDLAVAKYENADFHFLCNRYALERTDQFKRKTN